MITLKYMRAHFNAQGYELRHSLHRMKKALNRLSKEMELDAIDLFHLVIENEPMSGTHSYGFHTAYGRHLIDTFKSYYYQS